MEHGWFEGIVSGVAHGLYRWIPWLPLFVPLFWILVFVIVAALALIYVERKVSADIQARVGPLHHGPFGTFQTVFDALKLVQKEDLVPAAADKIVFCVAPFIVFVPAVALYVAIPFGKGWVAADMSIGVFYLIALGALGVVGVITGGWASNNKWSLLGAFRAAAQLITFEIPGFLALIAIVMMAGTLSLTEIVRQQSGGAWGLWPPQAPIFAWNVFTVPGAIAALLYLVAALAEVSRTPFDLPEAESELVAGYNTEYSGMRWAIFFLAEFSNLALVSAIATTVFFGGWASPFGPSFEGPLAILGDGILWFFAKVALLITGMMWVKWTLPRVRIDQMLAVAWKGLIPLGLINIGVAVAYVALRGW